MAVVVGKGTTTYRFDAGVYHVEGSFDYTFHLVNKTGSPYHVVETGSYTVSNGVVCAISVDFTFTSAALVNETATNVCNA